MERDGYQDELYERIAAAAGRKLDAQLRLTIDTFVGVLRLTIRRFIANGVSDVLIKTMAAPVVQMAYMQLLASLGKQVTPPTPELVDELISTMVGRLRSVGAQS